jgi:glycosyltransferase involved in cell wall biosynthesis
LRNEYSDLFRPKRVVFLGLLDVKHMADEYARCSLLCLPARAESAPMVIAEAMAAGKPVVATRVGGIPEMVEDGATGRLCVPGDPGQLAACLRELLTNDDLRRDMGERARCAAIQRYRADSVARATLDAYLRVLNTPSSSS